MKLYEVVENRNIGKIYKSGTGDTFKVIEHNENVILINVEDKSERPLAITAGLINLEVEEVKEIINPYAKPAREQKYYYIGMYNRVEARYWNNSIKDNTLYDVANCFLTKEEAERVADGTLHGRKIVKERTVEEFRRQEEQNSNVNQKVEKKAEAGVDPFPMNALFDRADFCIRLKQSNKSNLEDLDILDILY